LFPDSGTDPCPFHEDVLIKWEVKETEKGIDQTFSCPALNDGRCQVDQAPCPTEKLVEYAGLLHLRRMYDKLLRGGIFGRRP